MTKDTILKWAAVLLPVCIIFLGFVGKYSVLVADSEGTYQKATDIQVQVSQLGTKLGELELKHSDRLTKLETNIEFVKEQNKRLDEKITILVNRQYEAASRIITGRK